MDINQVVSSQDLIKVLPYLFLIGVGLVLMLMDSFKARSSMPLFTAAGFIGAILLAFPRNADFEAPSFAFQDMLATGGLASIVFIFLCASGLFTLFFLHDFLKRQDKPIYDVYTLLVFAVIGMGLLANANDLIISFIGLETMSICLYVMAALFKRDSGSNESGLKYFLLGAFASAFFIFGVSLIYGVAGTTNYSRMAIGELANYETLGSLLVPGVALVMIGFFFKVSAFPFHAWTPDVYTGAPTPLAGFMATGSKAAAFIAFGIFFNKLTPYIPGNGKFFWVMGTIALVTMIYGNVVAVQQKNLKRMLAYSSIAHSGYVLLGLCGGKEGLLAAIFYMFVYTLMNIGAFGLIAMVENQDESVEMEKLRGFGIKYPWLGTALAVFLFSLSGIPPLAGFMGKYFVFMSVIRANMVLFAVLGILTSVVGAYYYIRVIVTMFFEKSESHIDLGNRPWLPSFGIGFLAALTVLLGFYAYLVTGYIDSLSTMAAN